MPLNKLQNFIRNTDGRTLYVNPNDLDSTDAITNDGTSLTQPFKTIQRALLESARFSYLAGVNNDLVEKTTILLFPAEYIVDNRPGWGIRNDGGTARAFPPSGSNTLTDPTASSVLSLELNSNFDLTQEDNILYKFNSINGGIVVPRGTSIVGLDLRKTKIRPKYIPNPTDDSVEKSSIFRVTGACYFWQFSIFDGDESGLVYTHPYFFSSEYQSTPTFSHHKLTCFEYADGVNEVGDYGLTDLDMYYSKLSNAYNSYRTIPVNSKYPTSSTAFAKKSTEWEIVGAFATDPVNITKIISGDGTTASNLVTVTTTEDHNLNAGSPIKIRGVSSATYNVSTKVQSVVNSTQFTYLLPSFPNNLPASPNSSGATVTIETDTVSGASPYIFNCSLRSVWGMNGMLADGSKASGFRSMVVAQFTAVSLQKDDRAFVKYDASSRTYNGVDYTPNGSPSYGAELPSKASQTNTNQVYHLDPQAIYRQGWESSHIKITNDAFVQIVSVFAIGFNKHFDIESGGDASITNSNSNFGQISLNSDGFKAAAFDKDNNAFITSIIPPRDIKQIEENIEWLSIDVGVTTSAAGPGAATTTRLYLYGLTAKDSLPISVTQGYRIGARVNDKLYLNINDIEYSANIYMEDGVTSSYKVYDVQNVSSSILTLTQNHNLKHGEKIIINSETGDLPENVIPHTVYYAISYSNNQIKLSPSYTGALNNEAITIYGGTQLKVYSRVSDKSSGDIGSPIQFDEVKSNWYINVNSANTIYPQIKNLGVAGLTETTDLTYVKRIVDDRSLDEKLYKVRVVIPKESKGSKDPQTGFVIQESSSTGVGNSSDFTRTFITSSNYDYNKNPRFITTCTFSGNTVTVLADLPHNLNVNDLVIIRNVTDDSNVMGEYDRGYNGKFKVTGLGDGSGNYKDSYFRYSIIDVNGVEHTPGPSSTNNINNRTTALPRFERNDLQSNLYIYRNEVISSYIENSQDGIYHLYLLNASNAITEEFTNLKYSQSPVDLYPQLDRDNVESNPPAAKTFALRSPIGDTNTSDLKKSITRETIDKLVTAFGKGLKITSVSDLGSSAVLTFDRNHGLGGIIQGVLNTVNANYKIGTFYNVKLLNGNSDPLIGTWKGATAKVVVQSGGGVISVEIISPGSGYNPSEVLYLDKTIVGAGNGNATYTISSVSGISNSVGDVVQVTGIGTATDGYYRISSVNSNNQISVSKVIEDSNPIVGQYVFVVGPSVEITSDNYISVTGITSFTTSNPHGLLSGNKFRVINSTNNLGDYVVEERISTNKFTAITNQNISSSGGFILKHGLSSNEGISDSSDEGFATRQVSFYENEYLKLREFLDDDSNSKIVKFSWISTGIGTDVRFPLGSYIQIDNEIMRITSKGNSTQFEVIRGVLGTRKENHDVDSLIRKISPIPVEFRRPSILRASGHTFEYLGYGPGNYSTGLPQIQVRSLSEREDFLVQSQERSCGTVVYTGMNNNGDFFSGNTKTSSVSGEITSYDIPTPTVTGQDPSKSSVVYDEVTVKERLLVEGGDSGTVLSQFDGPVTFNQQTRFKATSTFSGNVRITNTTPSDSPTKGALTVKGGVGINENLNVAGNVTSSGSKSGNIRIGITNDNTIDTSIGGLTLNATIGNSVGISTNTTISGIATISGRLDANDGAEIDNIRIGVTNNNTIDTSIGGLTLNATIGNSVGISTNTTISGIATISGRLDANDGAEIDNIRIGVTGDNEIDTSSGNLTIDSAGGTTTIDDDLVVTGTIDGDLKYTISAGNGLTQTSSFNNTQDVTIDLIGPQSVTSSSTNSVGTDSHSHELSDGAVTNAKLDGTSGSEAVTTDKIRDSAVTTAKIGDNAVTADKLDGGQTGTAPIYGVRAWGKLINGDTSDPDLESGPAIGNLKNPSRSGTPPNVKYKIEFDTNMPNNNYAVFFTNGENNDGDNVYTVETRTTGYFEFFVFDPGQGNNTRSDTKSVFIMVVG